MEISQNHACRFSMGNSAGLYSKVFDDSKENEQNYPYCSLPCYKLDMRNFFFYIIEMNAIIATVTFSSSIHKVTWHDLLDQLLAGAYPYKILKLSHFVTLVVEVLLKLGPSV